MKTQERIVALYQHHRTSQVLKQNNRKMSIMVNHFTNMMVILANNKTESKINLMMTHAICCLVQSNVKQNSLTKHHMPQPFNKSSIQLFKVLGTK